MSNYSSRPRILLVTPEVAFVPEGGVSRTNFINAHVGIFDAFPAKLFCNLFELGVDVHLAQPDFRKIFTIQCRQEKSDVSVKLSCDRIHLAEDRAIFHSKPINYNSEWENIKISLAFQREVINQIAPRVQPDLIHCHDWMTGLIPAVAKEYGKPCLFTVRNADSAKSMLSHIEDMGIDAAAFWRHLFYDRFPGDYEETRDTNPLDMLLSGILAARYVETARFPLLPNAASCQSKAFYTCLRQVLAGKSNAGCACTLAAASDSSANAASDKRQYCNSGPHEHYPGKQKKERIMGQSAPSLNQCEPAYRYVDLYERILQQPLISRENKKTHVIDKDVLTKASDSQAVSYQKARSTNLHVLYNEQISTPAVAPI